MASIDGAAPTVPMLRHKGPWPVHPKPHADETMTSWLIRFAAAMGLPFQDLCAAAWSGRKVQQSNLNRCPSDGIVNSLKIVAGLGEDEIRATTLDSLDGVMFQGPLEGRTQWILPASGGKRPVGNQQFCPECLAEDAKPHYRLSWQLAFVTGCPQHGNRLLLDACPFCGHPLDPAHNHAKKGRNVPDLPITECRHCKRDLRNAVGMATAANSILPAKVDRIGQVLQAKLLESTMAGWMTIDGGDAIHSCLAFDGIHQIMKILVAKRSAASLWEVIGKRLRLDGNLLLKVIGTDGNWAESLGVGQRRILMAGTAWLLEEWPNRFVLVCKEAKVWSRHIKQDRRDRTPFWLDKVIDEYLKIQHAQWRDPALKGQKRAVDSYTRLGLLAVSSRLADRARKILFIREHLDLLSDLPGLAATMREARLYSPSTQTGNIVLGLPKLITAAQDPSDPHAVQGVSLAMTVRDKNYPFPRGRAYMTIKEEDRFMSTFWEREKRGIPITAKSVRDAMSEFLKKPVSESAIYKFLRRKGWQAPRSPKRKASGEATQQRSA
jgi:hypothetical protein